jgi:hypothetical protein
MGTTKRAWRRPIHRQIRLPFVAPRVTLDEPAVPLWPCTMVAIKAGYRSHPSRWVVILQATGRSSSAYAQAGKACLWAICGENIESIGVAETQQY